MIVSRMLGRVLTLHEYHDPNYPQSLIDLFHDPKTREVVKTILGNYYTGTQDARVVNDLASVTLRYEVPVTVVPAREFRMIPGASGETQHETPKVPRGLLDLTILLPFGSEAGKYDVQIQKEIDKPLVVASGSATIVDGVTTLRVRLNTSTLPSRRYLLGARRQPLDWVFAPVTLE